MLHDLRTALRQLIKTPWFTCITVLTLALGIGANTAIFGVVNKLLLNPLPYPDADRIVYMQIGNERGMSFSIPSFVASAWRDEARSLDGIEAWGFRDALAYDENGARVLRGIRVTPGLPAFLGVSPVLGRGFTAADVEGGAPAVVMLGYEAWQRDYGGAQDVLGRALTLDEVSHVVVGVMPAAWDAFRWGPRAEVYFPLALVPGVTSLRQLEFIQLLGRLRPDAPADAATADLDAILVRALADAPQLFGDNLITTRLEGPSVRVGANTRDALLVLLAAVGLVLLVACSNVANLLLARGASRARELSLRAALGASTWRLVRALFAECLVLALAAGVVGVAFAWLTLRMLMRLRPNSLSSLGEVQLDSTALVFTFGLAIATALLFGVAPALQLGSRKLGDALRHGASGVVRGGSGRRLRKALVAAQVAMSVVLLVSAGLLVRSFFHLQQVDVGFDTNNLFTAQLSLPRARYRETTSREVLSEQLLDRIRSSPGVAAVTQAFLMPPDYIGFVGTWGIRGVTLSEADIRAPRGYNSVRSDYFSTLGIRLFEGRTFTADEMRVGSGALIINRAAAERFWPSGGALGGEVMWAPDYWVTVVGVVDNIVAGGLTQSRDAPQFYMPFRLTGTPVDQGLVLLVRGAGDPATAIAAVRSAVREIDPEIAIPNVSLTETALANTIDAPRFNMALLTAFAVIGLVLAAVGLAAVIGYEVTERTHEFGIRMALGARAENVRRLAMRQGLTPALVGVVIGVVGALAATQLAASLLYGVAPRDPLTFTGVVLLLVLVAFGASWVPAKRATRVDPITALRAD
jgi:putative ABC transport system permease protein